MAPGPDSSLELKIDKTGLLRGRSHLIVFEQFSGQLEYDPLNPIASTVRLSIRSASAVCRDAWLGGNDQRKVEQYARNNMLAAEAHPEIRFVSGALFVTGRDRFQVHGALSIRGITKPAIVLVEAQRGNGGVMGFRGTAAIRLTDYGLKPPTAALGSIGTKDEMELRFQIAARPRVETD